MDSKITGVTALEALNPALVQQQILKAAEDYAPELTETGQTYIQAVPPVRLADNIKDGPQERYKAVVKSWEELRKNALELKSQGQKVVKFEVDESVPLSEFFPGLPQKTFGGISFRESSFEYRFEAIESQAAGAYLLTEVDLKGALNEILEVFDTLLDKAEPVLRLSAYVGERDLRSLFQPSPVMSTAAERCRGRGCGEPFAGWIQPGQIVSRGEVPGSFVLLLWWGRGLHSSCGPHFLVG